MKKLEEIVIKKVSVDDWEKFRDLRLKGLQTDPQAFGNTHAIESKGDKKYWEDRISFPDRFYYAAEKDDIFVASAGIKKITEDNRMIIAVYTIPEYRGLGLSKKIMNIVLDELKSLGIKTASLMVNVHQEVAVTFYKKLGFEIIHIEKDQQMGDGKMYDEYYMEKQLS